MARVLKCEPSLLAKNLTGKTYVVTGANSGIGLVTARQLLKQGGQVVLACRRPEEAGKALSEIQSQGTDIKLATVMELNLADLASIRAFAEKFLDKFDRLDGLVNNAGVMNTPDQQTKDGFEFQFGVNHLGHFLLTHLLLDILKASEPSRIVNVSSCFHDVAMGKKGHIHFDDINLKKTGYNGWLAYAQSKLANLLHAKELAKRLAESRVTAVSVHPGWVRTNLMRNSMPIFLQNILSPVFRLIGMIEPWEGAQTSLHCLLDDDIPKFSGQFFSQTGTYSDKSCNKGGWPLKSPNAEANDPEVAKKLWELSESLVGINAMGSSRGA